MALFANIRTCLAGQSSTQIPLSVARRQKHRAGGNVYPIECADDMDEIKKTGLHF
jgi:hypothetical protein